MIMYMYIYTHVNTINHRYWSSVYQLSELRGAEYVGAMMAIILGCKSIGCSSCFCKEHRSWRVWNCISTILSHTTVSYCDFSWLHIRWDHIAYGDIDSQQDSSLWQTKIRTQLYYGSEAVAYRSASEGLGTGAKPRRTLRRHRDGLTTSETTRWRFRVKTLWWMDKNVAVHLLHLLHFLLLSCLFLIRFVYLCSQMLLLSLPSRKMPH